MDTITTGWNCTGCGCYWPEADPGLHHEKFRYSQRCHPGQTCEMPYSALPTSRQAGVTLLYLAAGILVAALFAAVLLWHVAALVAICVLGAGTAIGKGVKYALWAS